MRIEKLEKSKRRQGRILVHLEGGRLLRVTEAELLHFDLYTGLDMTPEAVVELEKRAARSETRRRAADMVSARPLSKQALQKRLCDRGADEGDAEAAADWLESIGALDDAAYARTVVRHYSASGYGAARIRDELHRRGVPRAYWDEALETAPPAEETVARVIEAKTKGKPLDEKGRRRLSDALLRRGFSWSEIKSALDALGDAIGED